MFRFVFENDYWKRRLLFRFQTKTLSLKLLVSFSVLKKRKRNNKTSFLNCFQKAAQHYLEYIYFLPVVYIFYLEYVFSTWNKYILYLEYIYSTWSIKILYLEYKYSLPGVYIFPILSKYILYLEFIYTLPRVYIFLPGVNILSSWSIYISYLE